jgi:hypothetical protein
VQPVLADGARHGVAAIDKVCSMHSLANQPLSNVDLAAGGMILVLVLLLVALLYAIPAIALLRKGHIVGGVLCFILAMLLLLGAIGQATFQRDQHGSAGADWFFYGGGFVWMLLLIWSAGAPDLVYRRKQHEIANDLNQRLNNLQRRLSHFESQGLNAPPHSFPQLPSAVHPRMFVPTSPLIAVPPRAVSEPATPTPLERPPARNTEADPDATPIMPQPPVDAISDNEIKVRCKACGKKFGGKVADIAKLKACPRCKASPFESTPAE